MSLQESERTITPDKMIIHDAPTQSPEATAPVTGVHEDDDLSTFSLGPLALETHSVSAVDPEYYARLLSKEGPIPEYDIADNRARVEMMQNRYSAGHASLRAGMAAIDRVREEAVNHALIDQEKAHDEAKKRIAMVESIKDQLLRSVEDWSSKAIREIETVRDNRVAVDEQIESVAGDIKNYGLEACGNILRELNGGTNTLKIVAEKCEQAEKEAQRLYDYKLKIEDELEKQRANLRKHNEGLVELRARRESLPREIQRLIDADKTERQAMFQKYLDDNGAFNKFDDDYHAMVRRSQEIMDGFQSVSLSRIAGDIETAKKDSKANEDAYLACMDLITTCTADINQLEQAARAIPQQIIEQHDKFLRATAHIKHKIEAHSQITAIKAGTLGPVALGEATLTADDAKHLSVLTIAQRSQQLRILSSTRQAIAEGELVIDFNPQLDLPQLVDPFGETVTIPKPHQFLRRPAAEQAPQDGSESMGIARLKGIGKQILEYFGYSNDGTLIDAETQREITA